MKVAVVGDAVVLTSDIKLEDIKLVEKYRPEALIVFGGEDGKEPQFRIGSTTGVGNINAYGASFAGEARDGSGKATITLTAVGVDTDDLKEKIADQYGVAIGFIKKLEGTIPAVAAEITDERNALIASITLG